VQRAVFTCCALLIAQVCSGQALPPVTTDPAAARHTMVRAAGMPLNDGALAPGMLTVRVVRGAFTANLADVTVTADVSGGSQEMARTGSDGRAQFAHLPVGAQVRVSAVVTNQQLTSDAFVLPADSGVRILLVADAGADAETVPSAAGAWPALSVPVETIVPPADSAPARRGPSTGVLAIRIFLTVATLAAFAFVLFRQTVPTRSARE
jgi:hypothetical protein